MIRSSALAALVCLSVSIPTSTSFAKADPSLSIVSGTESKTWSRKQLWDHPAAQTLEVKDDPAYPGKTMVYHAVPAWTLFEGITVPADATLLFRCLDGFSAPINRDRVLAHEEKASIAFIAIEPEKPRWPEVKAGQTAGPFYLVWKDPKKSGIAREEWPFQLASFEVKPSVASQFPQILPDPDLGKNHAVSRGYQAFVKNCFACHTMNRQGASHMGPDLNVPRNPTEYLGASLIRVVVRNPQNLRFWPESKMAGFTREQLSDSDLSDIIAYLKHMAGRKVRGGPSGTAEKR